MKRSIGNKEFSSTTGRASKILILAAMAVLVVGCGGGGGDEPAARNTTSSGGSSLVDFLYGLGCFLVTNGQPGCLDDNSTTTPSSTRTGTVTAVCTLAYDVEPNDSISTAYAVSPPTPNDPGLRRGICAPGTINNLTDGIDTYAFTAARSRTFGFRICDPTTTYVCPNGSLSLAVAHFSVLDQFGNVVLSSQGDNVRGNYQEMPIDAGVLYYVMVIAEDTANRDREYTLRVFETIDQPEPEVVEESDPSAPILSAGEATFLTTTLDWIAPTMNVDGTPLLDLAGYNVYFGPESGMYLDFRHLDNPGLVTYVLDLPSSGSWWITITALDSAGNESDFGNELVVNVSDLPPPGMP